MNKIESLHKQSSYFELFAGSKSVNNIRLYKKLGYKVSHTQPLSDKVELCFMQKINPFQDHYLDLDPGALYRQLFHSFKNHN